MPKSTIGRAQVYLGSAAQAAWTPAKTLIANKAGDTFGRAVSTAGDVNGDSFADILVGQSASGFPAAAAFLYYGSATGLDANGTRPPIR